MTSFDLHDMACLNQSKCYNFTNLIVKNVTNIHITPLDFFEGSEKISDKQRRQTRIHIH